MNFVGQFKTISFRPITHSGRYYIIPVIFLTLTWNIPRFLELESCYNQNGSKVIFCDKTNLTESDCFVTICFTEMRQNLSYCRDYILIGNFLIMVFIPFLLLSILNGQIYRAIARSSQNQCFTSSRQKRDHRIATILLTIVIVFGCCNIPRVSINLFEVRGCSIII